MQPQPRHTRHPAPGQTPRARLLCALRALLACSGVAGHGGVVQRLWGDGPQQFCGGGPMAGRAGHDAQRAPKEAVAGGGAGLAAFSWCEIAVRCRDAPGHVSAAGGPCWSLKPCSTRPHLHAQPPPKPAPRRTSRSRLPSTGRWRAAASPPPTRSPARLTPSSTTRPTPQSTEKSSSLRCPSSGRSRCACLAHGGWLLCRTRHAAHQIASRYCLLLHPWFQMTTAPRQPAGCALQELLEANDYVGLSGYGAGYPLSGLTWRDMEIPLQTLAYELKFLGISLKDLIKSKPVIYVEQVRTSHTRRCKSLVHGTPAFEQAKSWPLWPRPALRESRLRPSLIPPPTHFKTYTHLPTPTGVRAWAACSNTK